MVNQSSFPPMPSDPLRQEFRERPISSFNIGNVYKTKTGDTLYVISVSYSVIGDKYSGNVKFRDRHENLVIKDAEELKDFPLKIIFGM